MNRESQYRRFPSRQTEPAKTELPTKTPYPVKNDAPEPSLSESFQAGWQYGGAHLPNTALTAEEWYDFTQLTPQDWIQKYRQPKNAAESRKAYDEYRYWSQHLRKRQQKLQQPNWLERALLPSGLRNKVPGLIRAII